MNSERIRWCALPSAFAMLGPLVAAFCCGQEPASGLPSTIDPESEIASRWQYFVPIQPPAANDGLLDKPGNAPLNPTAPGLVEIILGPAIFTRSRRDLADLRLYDAQGSSVPYALRYLRSQSVQDRVTATEFNRSETDAGPTELSLDLKQNDIQHNEVTIVTDGTDFRRAVEVDGSDDSQNWRRLATTNLIRYSRDEQKIDLKSVHYPPSRFRYVRVRVKPDEARANDEFTLNEVHVLRHIELPERTVMLEGLVGLREPVRRYGVPGSAWIVDLGGDNIPCNRIEVDVADREFNRDIQLEAEFVDDTGRKPRFTAIALSAAPTWQRRTGDQEKPSVAQFAEIQARRFRLFVADHRNPPITIQAIRFGAPIRQVLFAAPSFAESPMKLAFGNARAELPNYDFARNLPAQLPQTPFLASLGEVQRNPDFVPAPQPFTERFPWLIYVVLGSVSIVLAGVIVNLSRSAIAIHDAGN